ncbi:ankyrin repeat domain-containing protein [Aliikangiella sp. IMCC44359]|uniref:ankyrin repeat domain-containing protein n=1 Tax=Aliikangiella sp. IMCC44359 TaxID=3459125 RepID=UPI00403B0239
MDKGADEYADLLNRICKLMATDKRNELLIEHGLEPNRNGLSTIERPHPGNSKRKIKVFEGYHLKHFAQEQTTKEGGSCSTRQKLIDELPSQSYFDNFPTTTNIANGEPRKFFKIITEIAGFESELHCLLEFLKFCEKGFLPLRVFNEPDNPHNLVPQSIIDELTHFLAGKKNCTKGHEDIIKRLIIEETPQFNREIIKSDIPIESPPYIDSHSSSASIDLNPYNHSSVNLYRRDEEIKQLTEFLNEEDKFSFMFVIAPSGAGKTRLVSEWMRNNVSDNEWQAGFVYENSLENLKKWRNWKPTCNALIVVDYIYRFKDVIDLIVKAGERKQEYKIRLLILDHVLPSRFDSEGLDSLTLDAIDRDGTRLNYRTQFLHKYSPMRLDESNSRKELIFDIISEVSGFERGSWEVARAYDVLKGMSDGESTYAEHPLFAILIAESIKNGIEKIAHWKRKDLINHYFRSTRRIPWKGDNAPNEAVGSNLGVKVGVCVSVATVLQGIPFSHLYDCLSGEIGLTQTEKEEISAWCNRIVSSQDTNTLKKFEPDIMGENFFLTFFREYKDKKEIHDLFVSMLCIQYSEKIEIIDSFIEFFIRLARNLANDELNRFTEQAWKDLSEFLNPVRFTESGSLYLTATLTNIEVSSVLSGKAQEVYTTNFINNVNVNSILEAGEYFNSTKDFRTNSPFFRVGFTLVKYFNDICRLKSSFSDIEKVYFQLLEYFKTNSGSDRTAIFLPCFIGGLDAFDWIVKNRPVSLNQIAKNGNIPIFVAASYGYTNIVSYMFESGQVEIDKPHLDRTALLLACKYGQEDIVRFLIETEVVDLNRFSTISFGTTPLIEAISNKNEAVVRLLLETKKININQTTLSKLTPVMLASENGHVGIVQSLLSSPDIKLDMQSGEGVTALMFACGKGHTEIVRLLLETNDVDVNKQNKNGTTALMLASEFGHDVIVRLLLCEEGIRASLTDSAGSTALKLACIYGHEKVVHEFGDSGKIDMDMTDYEGATAIMYASQYGHSLIVKYLLKIDKIDINRSFGGGTTALMLAVQNGHEKIVEDLVSFENIDVNSTFTGGYNALMLACIKGNETIVRLLANSKNIKINAQSDDGNSALMLASQHGHETIARYLLELEEIDINAQNNAGFSVLMFACCYGQESIVHSLLSTGKVKVSQKNTLGENAVLLALTYGHETIAQRLLSKAQ